MNDTLKAVGNIGAELGAAKAEVARLREALKRIIDRCEAFIDDEAEMRTPSVEVLMGIAEDAIYTVHEADVALSQQAEPTDTYTAVDMATAAAQGFRDGQAAVELAPAQDELLPDEIHQMAFEEGQPAEDGDGYLFTAEEFDLFVERLLSRANRPAQTEQPPVGHIAYGAQAGVVLYNHLPQLPDGAMLYAAPFEQAEQSRLAEMIDAAMVEMRNIAPPLRRSDCARLIRAALSAQGAGEQ